MKKFNHYHLQQQNLLTHLLTEEEVCSILGIRASKIPKLNLLPLGTKFRSQSRDIIEASLTHMHRNGDGIVDKGIAFYTYPGVRKIARIMSLKGKYKQIKRLSDCSNIFINEYIGASRAQQILNAYDGILESVNPNTLSLKLLDIGKTSGLGELYGNPDYISDAYYLDGDIATPVASRNHVQQGKVMLLGDKRYYSKELILEQKEQSNKACFIDCYFDAAQATMDVSQVGEMLKVLNPDIKLADILAINPTDEEIAIVNETLLARVGSEGVAKIQSLPAVIGCLGLGSVLYTKEAIARLLWSITGEACSIKKIEKALVTINTT